MSCAVDSCSVFPRMNVCGAAVLGMTCVMTQLSHSSTCRCY